MGVHYTWDVRGSVSGPITSPIFSGILCGRHMQWRLMLNPDPSYVYNETQFELGFFGVALELIDSQRPLNNVKFWGECSVEYSGTNAKFNIRVSTPGYASRDGRNSHSALMPIAHPVGSVNFNNAVTSSRDNLSWRRSDLRNCLLDDVNFSLKIHCCISDRPNNITHQCSENKKSQRVSKRKKGSQTDEEGTRKGLTSMWSTTDKNLNAGFWDLYQHQKFVDVTFSVGPEKFKVHKSVMAARSEIFANMFENNLLDKQTSTVIVQDIKPAVFEEVIRFIYLDVVERLDEFTLELLASAEKYQLKSLKALCVQRFLETLSVASVAEVLVAAHLNNSPSLKAKAIAFIAQNLKQVMKTTHWTEVRRFDDITDAIFLEVAKLVPQ